MSRFSSRGPCFITKHQEENFTFAWRIENFSKMLGDEYLEFSTETKTKWMIKLADAKSYDFDCLRGLQFRLIRCSEGQPVKVEYDFDIQYRNQTSRQSGVEIIQNKGDSFEVVFDDVASKLYPDKSDNFILKGNMHISGHRYSDTDFMTF